MFINYKPVDTGSPCNFNCLFCGLKKTTSEYLDTERLKSLLVTIPESESIEFTGGELFIRKDAMEIVSFAGNRFRRVKYNTNGAVFAYKNVIESAFDNGLKIIYMKFFTTDPKAHETITKTDTLKHAIKGFENLAIMQNSKNTPSVDSLHCDFFFAVDTFAHSLTLPTLKETTAFITMSDIPRFIINFNCSDCVSDEAISTARECVELSVENGTWAIIKGLPMCAMRDFEEHCGDAYRFDRYIPGNIFIPDVCDRCVLFSVCGGIPEAIAGKRRWTPITSESKVKNLDHIMFFHSIIPEERPFIKREARL